jgi:hypothetical protein
MPYFNKVWVPAPNTLQVEMTYGSYGGVMQNVYHVQGTGSVTDIDLLANKVLDAVIAWDGAHLKQWRYADSSLFKVVVRDIGQESGPAWERALVVYGTNAGAMLPDSVTVAVKWVTGRSGRSYRGRTYHCGLTDTMRQHDDLAPAALTGLTAAYNALIPAMSGLDILGTGLTSAALVVVSASHNKAARATAEITPITAAVFADGHLDSQRRRLAGRGV